MNKDRLRVSQATWSSKEEGQSCHLTGQGGPDSTLQAFSAQGQRADTVGSAGCWGWSHRSTQGRWSEGSSDGFKPEGVAHAASWAYEAAWATPATDH